MTSDKIRIVIREIGKDSLLLDVWRSHVPREGDLVCVKEVYYKVDSVGWMMDEAESYVIVIVTFAGGGSLR